MVRILTSVKHQGSLQYAFCTEIITKPKGYK